MSASSSRPVGQWLLQASTAVACILGLWAPWDRYFGALATTLTWLYIPGLLVRYLDLSFSFATVSVTLFVLCLVTAGAILRVFANASVLRLHNCGSSSHSDLKRITIGPTRTNQLTLTSIGAMLVSLGVIILMPPSGAIFFLIFLSAAQLFIYFSARRSTVAFAPDQNDPKVISARPHAAMAWGAAAASESFAIMYAMCLWIFAWRYNPHLLLRCLLICVGLSLVVRAVLPADWRPNSQMGRFEDAEAKLR